MSKGVDGVFECAKCGRKFYWMLPIEMDRVFPCPVCHDVYVKLVGFMHKGSVTWASQKKEAKVK